MICKKHIFLTLGLVLLSIWHTAAQVSPQLANDQPRADSLDIAQIKAQIHGNTMGAKLESLLFWSQAEKEQRFPIMQKIFPSIKVEAGTSVSQLNQGQQITPKWLNNNTLKHYMATDHIAGVIVIQNDSIRLEAYRDGITKQTLWTSFSMAKSVSSMLLGVALKKGISTA